ncbi:MAG: hypothetical protein QXR17_08840 [Candidatus Bathyarchaeia archaeon]
MLNICSSGSVLNEIVSLLNIILYQCSSLSIESLKEKLDWLEKLRKEYLVRCYLGIKIDQDLLSWVDVAKKGLESCIKLAEGDSNAAETLRLITFIMELYRLLDMDADSISRTLLEGKSERVSEIKKLYLAGLDDIINKVNDESIKYVLESLWRNLKLDLKRGVEMYAIKKGLIDLALRIEILQDEGLSTENILNQLIKSELRSLINEVGLTVAHGSIKFEALNRIMGYLKRFLALADLAKTLGLPKLKSLDKELEQLRNFEYQVESIRTSITPSVLENLKAHLNKIYSFLE